MQGSGMLVHQFTAVGLMVAQGLVPECSGGVGCMRVRGGLAGALA